MAAKSSIYYHGTRWVVRWYWSNSSTAVWKWVPNSRACGLVVDYGAVPESLPHHKPRRSKQNPQTALTDAQRAGNRVHTRRRVKVEYAISGAKRLG